jgi:hypothetical protein
VFELETDSRLARTDLEIFDPDASELAYNCWAVVARRPTVDPKGVLGDFTRVRLGGRELEPLEQLRVDVDGEVGVLWADSSPWSVDSSIGWTNVARGWAAPRSI